MTRPSSRPSPDRAAEKDRLLPSDECCSDHVLRHGLTLAERSCRRAGYCVFTLGADRCSICHRTRDGHRA